MKEKEPKRKHSKATIQLMRIKRQMREVQPRTGTSRKRQTVADELMHDYKKNKQALDWIKKNKDKFGDAKKVGIITEFSDTYRYFHEESCGQIIFDAHEVSDYMDGTDEGVILANFDYEEEAEEEVEIVE